MNELNTRHGHVRPTVTGAVARCGGPALCLDCALEATSYARDPNGDVIRCAYQTINKSTSTLSSEARERFQAYTSLKDVTRDFGTESWHFELARTVLAALNHTCVYLPKTVTLNAPEPPPKPSDATPAWDLVMADIRERDAMGAKKYGQRLTPMDGRRSLVDAYQELLDLVVYLRKELYERPRRDAEVRNQALEEAAKLIEDWGSTGGQTCASRIRQLKREP